MTPHEIKQRFKKARDQYPILSAVLWTSFLGVNILVGQTLDPVKNWLYDLLPFSVGALDSTWWTAFGLTAASALAAWLFSVVFGYLTALVAAAGRLASIGKNGAWKWLRFPTPTLYRWVYVIPFVLTVNIAYNVLFFCQDRLGFPQWLVGVLVIVTAGAALGGYKVFHAVFHAAVGSAKFDGLVLSRTLYSSGEVAPSRSLTWGEGVRLAVRLRDCEIQSFASGIEDAFHLSLVAVMIVESILPAFYENIFPQGGASVPAFGGVGRLVISAQQSLTPQMTSGILWLVVIYDGIFTALIRFGCRQRWHRFYGHGLKEAT